MYSEFFKDIVYKLCYYGYLQFCHFFFKALEYWVVDCPLHTEAKSFLNAYLILWEFSMFFLLFRAWNFKMWTWRSKIFKWDTIKFLVPLWICMADFPEYRFSSCKIVDKDLDLIGGLFWKLPPKEAKRRDLRPSRKKILPIIK